MITSGAVMEGGKEATWQKGQERLKALKPSIVAFYSTDAQSQDLMKTGEAAVQVMLSVNAYHLQEQGIAVKVVEPKDYPGVVGIDCMSVMAGTTKADAAYQFINLALSREIQTELAKALKAGPVNGGATVAPAVHRQPGSFLTPAGGKESASSLKQEVRGRDAR